MADCGVSAAPPGVRSADCTAPYGMSGNQADGQTSGYADVQTGNHADFHADSAKSCKNPVDSAVIRLKTHIPDVEKR